MPTTRTLVGTALAALLYAAAAGAANAAGLDGEGRAALRAAATGEMSKLVVHEAAKDRLEAAFGGPEGGEVTLAEFEGRVVLVNFWATWCPPCRAEMPSIDRLAAELEGEPVAIVPVSTDFGDDSKPKAFFEEIGVERLEVYHDRSKDLAREAAVMGLPVTILLDREGREVARLVGDAHWDSAEAIAVMRALLSHTAGGA
jgi:thiol-disulfide isomerase/thioredoxin